ncbi:MAG: DUF3842 family protein [Lachnospiraceae bacterium]|nr:DUF3842 family protein [Lachnospiraceae bacterium]
MGNATNILVIDGQGGGLGKQLVSALKGLDNVCITAVGTNSAATAAMRKAGADQTATGENSVLVTSRDADIILGAVGIVMADAFLGEITPAMALAVGRSRAEKILIPMNRCGIIIAGCTGRTTAQCVEDAVAQVKLLTGSQGGSQK